jgi:hypothetical protein
MRRKTGVTSVGCITYAQAQPGSRWQMKISVLAALVSFFSSVVICSAYAQTHVQDAPSDQRTVSTHSAVTSISTKYRTIGGQERPLAKEQPNLKHYCWVPMLESGRLYKMVAAGQSELKGVSRYPKPRLAAVPNRAIDKRKRITIFVPTQHHSGIYIRPRHVPTVRPSKDTSVALSTPRVNGRLSRRSTNARLAAPSTNLQLVSHQPRGGIYVKPRHVPTVRPATNTNLVLTAPRTQPQLATRQTIARLAHQDVAGQLNQPDTQVELSYNNLNGVLAQRSVYGNIQSSRVKGHVLLPTKAY